VQLDTSVSDGKAPIGGRIEQKRLKASAHFTFFLMLNFLTFYNWIDGDDYWIKQ
jgi:hypothetical protein